MFSVSAKTSQEVIAQDSHSDGMFPLITNCNDLSKAKILEAYKFQPHLEKRHEQLKSVEDVAPVYLKQITRTPQPERGPVVSQICRRPAPRTASATR